MRARSVRYYMYRVLLQYPVKKQERQVEKKSEGIAASGEMHVEAPDTREHRAIRQVERMYVCGGCG